MIKINKWMSKEQIKRFIIFFGLGSLLSSILELMIFIVKIKIILITVPVFLVIPYLSVLFDGLYNRFLLKKVEIFKICIGLFMSIGVILLIFIISINKSIVDIFRVYILSTGLFIIGFTKLYIGIINNHYSLWYRKLLFYIGILIIAFSLLSYFISSLKVEIFAFSVFITLIFDGLSNLIYGLSKNIEKTEIFN